MKSLLAGFCILSVLTVPGASLFCYNCTDLLQPNCTSNLVSCQSSQTHCVSVLRQTDISGQKQMSIIKFCGVEKDCNQFTSTNAGNFQMITVSKCCNKDNCYPPQINIPPKEKNQNGLHCMSCYSTASHTCDNKENITCVGPEERCVQYSVTVRSGGSETENAVHGCTTKNLCDTKGSAAYYSPIFEMKTFQCSSGTRPQLGLFLSALTVLLLMKLFS